MVSFSLLVVLTLYKATFQLPKMPGKLYHDKFLVDKLGPFVVTDFVKSFFLLHFFTVLPVTLNLAYFAPLNGAGRHGKCT